MPSSAADLLTVPQFSPETFRRIAGFITRELGIKMSEAKIPMLQSRLHRRMQALGLPTLEEYGKYFFSVADSGTELAEFIDAVTTNKTDFFREPEHFDYLTGTVLPALAPNPGEPWPLKVWCAGCSSGEEPYTLAMVLSEYRIRRAGFDFAILATDVSTRVLQAAREAIYDESRIEPVPPELRKKYLLRSRDASRRSVRIVPELRARVQFHRLNFMQADYGVRDVFDVIFFRNVMIYFDKPTQEAVITRLCRHLRPGGHLFFGHSESLVGLNVALQMVASAVYRK